MRPVRLPRCLVAVLTLAASAVIAHAQVIEYETNGIRYQTTTRAGLTVIVTQLAAQVAGFGMIQVSISNGGSATQFVRPKDFSYVRPELSSSALDAGQVVDLLLGKASSSDVIKLVTSYESSLYGIPNMRTNNGYEQRRQNFMSYGMPARLKAAATASAIALADTKLAPGQSTDGAVFIPLSELKTLSGGHIVFRCAGEIFTFNPDPISGPIRNP